MHNALITQSLISSQTTMPVCIFNTVLIDSDIFTLNDKN